MRSNYSTSMNLWLCSSKCTASRLWGGTPGVDLSGFDWQVKWLNQKCAHVSQSNEQLTGVKRSRQLAVLFTAHAGTHFKGSLAKQGLWIARNLFFLINTGRDSGHDFSSLITRYPSHGEGIECSFDGSRGRLNTSDLLSCRKTHPCYPPTPTPYPHLRCWPTASVEALSVDVCTSSHTTQLNYK